MLKVDIFNKMNTFYIIISSDYFFDCRSGEIFVVNIGKVSMIPRPDSFLRPDSF